MHHHLGYEQYGWTEFNTWRVGAVGYHCRAASGRGSRRLHCLPDSNGRRRQNEQEDGEEEYVTAQGWSQGRCEEDYDGSDAEEEEEAEEGGDDVEMNVEGNGNIPGVDTAAQSLAEAPAAATQSSHTVADSAPRKKQKAKKTKKPKATPEQGMADQDSTAKSMSAAASSIIGEDNIDVMDVDTARKSAAEETDESPVKSKGRTSRKSRSSGA